MTRYVFVDTETSGLKAGFHQIVQLAAIAVDLGPEGFTEVDAFDALVTMDEQAQRRASPDALAVNRYDPVRWAAEGASPLRVARQFNDWLQPHRMWELTSAAGNVNTWARIAGHNITKFDIPFIQTLMDLSGFRMWGAAWWYPFDTLPCAVWALRDRRIKNFQLGTLHEYLGLGPIVDAHDALADVRATARVAHVLLHGNLPDASG